MAHSAPGNPVKRGPAKFRRFDGIGGPRVQILERQNQRGADISNTISNEVVDFTLTEAGTLKLRDGARKVSNSGFSGSVRAIFGINLGGVRRYGVIESGALQIATIPTMQGNLRSPLDFTPVASIPAVATVYPAATPEMPT